jgi:hypothetical protein
MTEQRAAIAKVRERLLALCAEPGATVTDPDFGRAVRVDDVLAILDGLDDD